MTLNSSQLCPICGDPNFAHFGEKLISCKAKRKASLQYLQRRTPPPDEQRRIMNKQQGKCFKCKQYWKHVEFHHVNGRWSSEDTVALCKDCHGDFTHGGKYR